jgi:hypothetical protein
MRRKPRVTDSKAAASRIWPGETSLECVHEVGSLQNLLTLLLNPVCRRRGISFQALHCGHRGWNVQRGAEPTLVAIVEGLDCLSSTRIGHRWSMKGK